MKDQNINIWECVVVVYTYQPVLNRLDWSSGIIHVLAGDPTDRNVFLGLRDREE